MNEIIPASLVYHIHLSNNAIKGVTVIDKHSKVKNTSVLEIWSFLSGFSINIQDNSSEIKIIQRNLFFKLHLIPN